MGNKGDKKKQKRLDQVSRTKTRFFSHTPISSLQTLISLVSPITLIPSQQGFIKFTKRTLVSYLIISIVFFGTGLIYLFNPFSTGSVEAAWFNDNWGYRKEVPVTANTGVDTNSYISFTLDTAALITAGQLQSACQDLRITDVGGTILKYRVGRTNACNLTNTTIDALVPTLGAGASTFYVYYGNPSVGSAANSSNFTEAEAVTYTIGTIGSEQKSPSPTLYWKFDDAQGTNAEDSTTNALDGTLNNTPTWQTEDQCIAGKCIYFSLNGNKSVSKSDDAKLDFAAADNFSVSLWMKHSGPATGTRQILTKTAGAPNAGYEIYMDASGDLCFETRDGTNGADSACTSGVDFDDSQWHFVTGVKSGTSSVTLYVDGQQRAQDASIVSTGSLANTGTLYAGIDQDGTSNDWFGFIDEVKINRDQTARTAAQVLADFNARSNPEGVSSQQGNNIQNMPAALSNGLVGYWKMDESSWTQNCTATSVTDSSGNSNNGKSCPSTTGPTTAVGKFSYGGSFDNTDDYAEVADAASLDVTILTISAWVKLNTDTTGTRTVLQKSTAAGTDGYSLDINSGVIRFCAAGGCISSSGTLTAATWAHVTATFDGTNTRLYLNGALDTSSTTVTSVPANALVLRMGANSSAANLVNAVLDEARVYNRALSGAEVSQLYNWAPGPVGYWKMDEKNGTTLTDSSGSGNSATLTNAASPPTSTSGWSNAKYGGGVNFDGTNDYIISTGTTPVSGAQPFTMAIWANTADTGDSASNYYLYTAMHLGLHDAGSKSANLHVMEDSIRFETFGLGPITYTPSSSIAGQWHHVAATYDGTTVTLYVDGVKAGTLSATLVLTTDKIFIGSGSTTSNVASRYFKGKLDDARLYNYTRTQAQIIEDMNANHPAPGSPVGTPLGFWKFDEGYSTTANNIGSAGNSSTTYTGTLTNMTSPASATSGWTNGGKFGKGLLFDGTNDRVDWGDMTVLESLSQASWSMWVRPTTLATNQGILVKAGNAASEQSWSIATDGTTASSIKVRIASTTTDQSNYGVTPSGTLANGSWAHVMTVFDGTATGNSSRLKVYVNGVPQTLTFTGTIPATLQATGSIMRFSGWSDAGGSYFNGTMDELKIYTQALTADQVKLDMNRSSSEVLGALSDSSTAGNDNASTRTAQSSASQYCIPGDSTTCTGPVGEWNLDEGSGTSVNDSTGNGNTGTITAGTGGYVNGKVNKAYSFDLANTIINAGSGTTLDDMAGITIEAWIYPKSVGEGSNAFIVNKNLGNTQSAGWIFHYTSNNGLLFVVDGSTDMVRQSSNSVVTLNRWSHVAMSWTGTIGTATTARLFVNGKETGYQTTTNGASRVSDAARSLYIGNASSQDRTFDGFIDQVKVFNYGRTPAQIAWDYNQGKPIAHWKMDECQGTVINDMSGFSNTGTLTIGATGTYTTPGTCSTSSASSAWYNGATGKRNYSMAFDGTDDYITMGDVLDFEYTSPFTISTWVKTSTATPTSAQRLVSKTEAVSGVPGYLLGIRGDQSGDPYEFELRTTTSALSINFPRPSDTNWQHVVVAYTFNNTGTWADVVPGVKAYVNGVPATITDVSNGNPGSTTVNAGPFNIGTRNNGTQPFAGQIDDTKIFNYQLTATQVKSLYNDGATRYGPVTGAP